jgi:hypothetical protein
VSSKYLLPCLCGQQVAIEPRQAGETITCRCGASLLAPTMREICALEPAPAELDLPRSGTTWGWRHGLRLLGAMTLLSAIGWSAWLFLNPPVSRFDVFDPELIRQSAYQMSPSATWDNWRKAKEGLDRRVDQKYADQLAVYHVWQAVPVVWALIGVGLLIAGMVPWKRTRQMTKLE